MSDPQTPIEIIEYYKDLLILQYRGKPKARGTIGTAVTPSIMPQTTVQTLMFSPAPTSGSFALRYPDVATTSIIWNASAATIETQLRGIAGLEEVEVSGSIAGGLTIKLFGVFVSTLLEITSNTLLATASPVTITSAEIDEILPLAVQDGFNLLPGTTLAVGKQLDVLGKYVGVKRSGAGFSQVITLDDVDFYTFIRAATVLNSMGSSLSDIQNFIATFFPHQLRVYDYANMHMSYLVQSGVGSADLIQLFITEGFLPKPMGVQLTAVVVVPTIDKIFAFRTYELPALPSTGFNTYSVYDTSTYWLSYQNAINLNP